MLSVPFFLLYSILILYTSASNDTFLEKMQKFRKMSQLEKSPTHSSTNSDGKSNLRIKRNSVLEMQKRFLPSDSDKLDSSDVNKNEEQKIFKAVKSDYIIGVPQPEVVLNTSVSNSDAKTDLSFPRKSVSEKWTSFDTLATTSPTRIHSPRTNNDDIVALPSNFTSTVSTSEVTLVESTKTDSKKSTTPSSSTEPVRRGSVHAKREFFMAQAAISSTKNVNHLPPSPDKSRRVSVYKKPIASASQDASPTISQVSTVVNSNNNDHTTLFSSPSEEGFLKDQKISTSAVNLNPTKADDGKTVIPKAMPMGDKRKRGSVLELTKQFSTPQIWNNPAKKESTDLYLQSMPTEAPFLPVGVRLNPSYFSYFSRSESVGLAVTKSRIFIWPELITEHFSTHEPNLLFFYNLQDDKKQLRPFLLKFAPFAECSSTLKFLLDSKALLTGFDFYPCPEDDGQSYAFSLQQMGFWAVQLRNAEPTVVYSCSIPQSAIFYENKESQFVLLDNHILVGTVPFEEKSNEEVEKTSLKIYVHHFNDHKYMAGSFSMSDGLLYMYHKDSDKHEDHVHVYNPLKVLLSSQSINDHTTLDEKSLLQSYLVPLKFSEMQDNLIPVTIQISPDAKNLYIQHFKKDTENIMHTIFEIPSCSAESKILIPISMKDMSPKGLKNANDGKKVVKANHHLVEVRFGTCGNKNCVYILQHGILEACYYRPPKDTTITSDEENREELFKWVSGWEFFIGKRSIAAFGFSVDKEGDLVLIEANMESFELNTMSIKILNESSAVK